MTEHPKDTTRVAAGLKAAIHNPNVTELGREQAKVKLKDLGQDVEDTEEPRESTTHEESSHGSTHESRVLGGYKATLTNPYTSTEAKEHAEEVLREANILERNPEHTDEEHRTRVFAGYKAALKNDRVSEGAKQHAREVLDQYNIPY